VKYSIENVSKTFFGPEWRQASASWRGFGCAGGVSICPSWAAPARGKLLYSGCSTRPAPYARIGSRGWIRFQRDVLRENCVVPGAASATIYQQHNLVPSLTSLQNRFVAASGVVGWPQTVRSIFYPGANRCAGGDARASNWSAWRTSDSRELTNFLAGSNNVWPSRRVLMQKPEVILADEPIARSTRALADEIISLLIRVGAQGRRTLIVALHQVEFALEHFPRVIGLGEGRMRFDLPSNSVHDDVLQDRYGKHRPGATGFQDEKTFQREFGCSR